MKILSVEFKKGLTADDEILHDGIPQIAFIGRSNVGKSSVINTLVQRRDMARSSPTPGLTKVVNVFLVNKTFYLVDLPGYGFARGSITDRKKLRELIEWYFVQSGAEQKAVVLIIDAKVGVTALDMEMLGLLKQDNKRVIIIANKIDKIRKTEQKKQIDLIRETLAPHMVIPYSATEKIGVGELVKEILR